MGGAEFVLTGGRIAVAEFQLNTLPGIQNNHHTYELTVKHLQHRRLISTEEKAKVVAAGWGAYVNAALTI